MTQLFEKRGRRYIPWGNGQHWDTDRDAMAIGETRLIHCPAPGHYRTMIGVDPDRAGFLAAAAAAEHAMIEAMTAAAIGTTAMEPVPYTPQQLAIIDRFRRDMAATGALLPTWWTHGSAHEIAIAGIKAVEARL